MKNIINTIIPIIFVFGVFVLPLLAVINTKKKRRQFKTPRKVPYCMELPFEGSIGATYARLYDINNTNDGNIIGCFLIKWLLIGQIEIVNVDYGEPTIQLHAAEPDMPLLEASLYRMYMDAAGQDMILWSKNFKKWAYKNYRDIERWLLEYRAFYKNELIQMGVYEVVPVKSKSNTSKETELIDTPLGQDMTLCAFGFKRYLEDFTFVNESKTRDGETLVVGRSDQPSQSDNECEVRDVWDQYLIFAHLFCIADRVATQFKELYPNNNYHNDKKHIGGSFYLASLMVSTAFTQMVSISDTSGYGVGVGFGGFIGG